MFGDISGLDDVETTYCDPMFTSIVGLSFKRDTDQTHLSWRAFASLNRFSVFHTPAADLKDSRILRFSPLNRVSSLLLRSRPVYQHVTHVWSSTQYGEGEGEGEGLTLQSRPLHDHDHVDFHLGPNQLLLYDLSADDDLRVIFDVQTRYGQGMYEIKINFFWRLSTNHLNRVVGRLIFVAILALWPDLLPDQIPDCCQRNGFATT